MPGSTTNTDLLAVGNQLILTLNEVKSSMDSLNTSLGNLDLSVSNNFDPVTNVNFDTASIVTQLADLVAKDVATDTTLALFGPELASIKDNLLDMATDTDALANLQQIAGNTDHFTHFQQFPIFSEHFANIADRLAPDGESIQPTLLLLVKALEASIGVGDRVSDFEAIPTLDTTYALPDPAKCLACKRAVGHTVQFVYDVKQLWTLSKVVAVTVVGLTALISGGLNITISSAVLQAIIDIMFSWSQSDLDTLYSELLAIGSDLVCAVYNASDAETALADYEAVLDGATWSKAESPDIIKYILPVKPINKVFSAPETLSPEYYGRTELSDWTTYDCSTCEEAQFDFSCMPQTGDVLYGTPDPGPFDGGVWGPDIGTWYTLTSETRPTIEEALWVDIDDTYQMEIEILTMMGSYVAWHVNDCAGTPNLIASGIVQDSELPANVGIYTFSRFISTTGLEGQTFTLRMRRVT